MRKIEEAIQRQVISGGEIEDVLLDMDAAPENVMSAYRAALYGLLPATREEVMTVARDTVRLVPREVAEQYRLVPLTAEGRTLVVAVVTPLAPEVDEQLGFLLGFDIVFRIITDVRMWAALAHHYGIESPARARRIADKLRGRDAGKVPYVAPSQDGKVERDSLSSIPTKAGPDIDWDDDEGSEAQPQPVTKTFGVPKDRQRGAERPTPRDRPARKPTPPARPSKISSRPPRDGASASARPAPSRSEKTTVPEKTAVRFRGPMNARQAVEALSKARTRDEILEIMFVFSRQFFDYSALFVVSGDIAEGKDAYGSGPSRDVVAGIAIPLDVPGTFGAVRTTLETHVVDLNDSELDQIVARDMKRDESQPCIVVPITIRGRAVLILYGDQGGQPFRAADVPELIGLLPRVGEAFERIILQKKYTGYASPQPEQRSDLKAAAGRMSSPDVQLATGAPSTSSYRPSDPPTGRPVRRRKRSAPLDVLKVPRSAPPPPGDVGEDDTPLLPRDTLPSPRPVQSAPPSGQPPEQAAPNLSHTVPDGHAALAQAARRAAQLVDLDAVDHELDDEPDLTIDYDDEDERVPPVDRPPVRQSSPGADSSYSMVDAGEDRVSEPPTKRSSRRRKSLRAADPRRDTDGSSVAHDVVRLPAAAAPSIEVDVEVDAPMPDAGGPDAAPRARGFGEVPSVIVDMGEAVEGLVDDLIRCGPDDEASAVNALLSLGEAALPALVQRFPGPLWFDRNRPHRRLPRGRDISAITRGFVAFRERAVPYLGSLLSHKDEDTRFYAVLLSSEFLALRLLQPLAERVFDSDPGTQVLVLDVLKHYRKYPKELEEIMKTIRVEARVARRDVRRRQVAVRALGELRDAKSLPLLIELLQSDDRELVETVHRALVTLTRQDFGESPRRWQQWAERNESLHRIEWLIESLTHADDDIRAAAGDELKLITQEYYGYHPSSPRRDREIAQKKYRTWWEGEGRRRFG